MAFKQDIVKQFQCISETMLASLEIGRASTGHAGTKGRNGEVILMNFLRKFLPKRYSLSQGQIVSPAGSLSDQLDIIIHDETTYPIATVLETGDKVIFAHSVYAVISVKNRLFEIDEESQTVGLLDNLESVYEVGVETKNVTGLTGLENPISCFGFAFANEEKDLLTKINNPKHIANEFLTVLAVLDPTKDEKAGLYINPNFCVHKGQEKQIVFWPTGRDTLLTFYRTLFNILCSKDIVELGDLSSTREIIRSYKPWGEWGFPGSSG